MESTAIYQLSTTTPLVASSDDDPKDNALNITKQEVKANVLPFLLNNQQNQQQPQQGTVDNNNYSINYSTDPLNDLLIIVITPINYSNNQFINSYISELHNEYIHIHGSPAGKFLTPYIHMSFESFISKSKKLYSNAKNDSSNIDKIKSLDSQLHEVTNIIHTNINDLLNRGNNLNNLHDLSSNLKNQSAKYKKYATKINWDLWIKQNTPIAIFLTLLLLFILYKWFF